MSEAKVRCRAILIKGTISIICSLMCFIGAAFPASNDYSIGVYYFPGWKANQYGAAFSAPWEKIKTFPEREPLLGWYPEGDISIVEQQIQWMHDYGIDYVVYDWYWDGKRTYLEHGLTAYSQAKNKNLIKFTLLWANHNGIPKSHDEFTSMVHYWVDSYFPRKQYLRIDEKPAVFVFSQDSLRDSARKMGLNSADLIAEANSIAKQAGFPGIYFVASTEALNFWVKQEGPKSGFNAFSTYNYHRAFQGDAVPPPRISHSYKELAEDYKTNWNWILKNSSLPYFVPMSSGWDKRPWGGSKDSLHDNSVSSPESFEQHLLAAKALMDKYPGKSMKTGVICCWNEFGEGSYIEPTKKYQFQYLEKIKKVFNK